MFEYFPSLVSARPRARLFPLMASWSGRESRLWRNGLDVIRSRLRGMRIEDVSPFSTLLLIVHHTYDFVFEILISFAGQLSPLVGRRGHSSCFGLGHGDDKDQMHVLGLEGAHLVPWREGGLAA